MRVRFTPPNPFRIADHWVIPPSGAEIALPMRVLANGGGSEVTFHLFRQPEMDDARFAADAEWVGRDLATLKQVLEERIDERRIRPATARLLKFRWSASYYRGVCPHKIGAPATMIRGRMRR